MDAVTAAFSRGQETRLAFTGPLLRPLSRSPGVFGVFLARCSHKGRFSVLKPTDQVKASI